eukprot:9157760-Heterocapsa_arctica.AAC.1
MQAGTPAAQCRLDVTDRPCKTVGPEPPQRERGGAANKQRGRGRQEAQGGRKQQPTRGRRQEQ